MPPKQRFQNKLPGSKVNSKNRESDTVKLETSTPKLTRRDPSLLIIATTSQGPVEPKKPEFEKKQEPWYRRCKKYLYNKQDKTYCGRTCKSWAYLLAYTGMYMIFLSTYTMIFLYASLMILKSSSPSPMVDLLTYSENGVGLTATPTSENSYPLIWYRKGEAGDYARYVSALSKLMLVNNEKRDLKSDLGPCSRPPYGYGDTPCVIVRINKQLKWSAKPLQPDSPKAKEAPAEVRNWIKSENKKFWLHCNGHHSYDKEHVGRIIYYPDPPGFDSELFPLDINSKAPLVAVQMANFTLGISVAIECKLWYETGVSSVEFLLYVAPKMKPLRNNYVS